MDWPTLAVMCALAIGGPPSGECTVPGTVCEELKGATLVFLGEVINLNWDPRTDQSRPAGPQIVTFRVIKGLKGVTGPEITLPFAAAGEQPVFVKGQRQLVYAIRWSLSPQEWFAGCSRGGGADADDPEVLALQNLVHGVTGAVVEGSVVAGGSRLAGVRVTAESQQTRVTTHAVPNQAGQYLLWLAAGRYTLRFDVSGYQALTTTVVVPESARCVRVEPAILNRVATSAAQPRAAPDGRRKKH
jgi:hypothetical protein